MTTAFVSGATGYIAQQLIVLLLSKNYKVIGSVRTEEKGAHLKKIFNSSNFSYVIVSDLVKPGAFDDALKAHPEVEVFFHTASPVFFPDSDFENLVINPAIEGTKSALSAAHAYGKNIKKFVLTSSTAAIASSKQPDPLNEESWSEFTKEESVSSGGAAYSASKTFGERAAWKFIEDNKPTFTLNTVNPSYVFGPQAIDSEAKGTLNLSAEVIAAFLKLKKGDPLPPYAGGFIDVRDVAKAHLAAYEDDATIGKRLVLVSGYFSAKSIANYLRKTYPQLAATLPEFSQSEVEEALKGRRKWDLRKTAELLGFEYIGLEKSVKDTIDQIENSK